MDLENLSMAPESVGAAFWSVLLYRVRNEPSMVLYASGRHMLSRCAKDSLRELICAAVHVVPSRFRRQNNEFGSWGDVPMGGTRRLRLRCVRV